MSRNSCLCTLEDYEMGSQSLTCYLCRECNTKELEGRIRVRLRRELLLSISSRIN